MTKPSLGRIVIANVDPARNAGLSEAPAVITRVWSDTEVNVMVLPDTGVPFAVASVILEPKQPAPAVLADEPNIAWWPARS